MTPETQVSLILRLRDGELREIAWREFWEKYRGIIYHWAKRLYLSDDDAEEIVSRVMSKLIEKMPTFEYDPQKKFRAWLKTVTRNTAFDFLSQLGRIPGGKGQGTAGDETSREFEQPMEPDDDLVEELNSELENTYASQMRILNAVKARVQPTTWNAFWLTTVEGIPGTDVAKELGIPVASVYMAKSRVTNMLRSEAQ